MTDLNDLKVAWTNEVLNWTPAPDQPSLFTKKELLVWGADSTKKPKSRGKQVRLASGEFFFQIAFRYRETQLDKSLTQSVAAPVEVRP